LDAEFAVKPQSSDPLRAGVRTAILGSLWTIAITILFAFPVGVSAAIYLEEYAGYTFINRIIQTNIHNLAGVPSIIYGILGLAIFVRVLEPLTSGALFGVLEDPTTANGRTILSAGLTLGLLILPLIIINAQEAIRAVPNSLRQASFGLGASKWQTVWSHVLPNALPGILTGTILSVSRAIGETAPLVVVGASTFITIDPSGPFSKFTTLPIQIFQWTARPQAEFRNIAAAAIIILLILLLTLNASAVLLRNRYSQRM
jgi:phosphate transport system permease protein